MQKEETPLKKGVSLNFFIVYLSILAKFGRIPAAGFIPTAGFFVPEKYLSDVFRWLFRRNRRFFIHMERCNLEKAHIHG